MDIRGKNVIITGASSGIGLALAEELGRRGAGGIALLARRAEPLEGLAEGLRANGIKAAVLPTDVTDEAAVVEAVRRAQEALGPLDIAVANAGISEPRPAAEGDNDVLRRTFAVNVFGAAYLFHAVLPQMIARSSGLLVGVSSIAGFRGLPGNGAYSASKSALTNLMEAYRVELEPQGVGVTVVSPGYVQTPILSDRAFDTPFIIEVEEAACHIGDAIEGDRAHVVFPWQMGALMGALSHLPQSVYKYVGRSLMAQRAKQKKEG